MRVSKVLPEDPYTLSAILLLVPVVCLFIPVFINSPTIPVLDIITTRLNGYVCIPEPEQILREPELILPGYPRINVLAHLLHGLLCQPGSLFINPHVYFALMLLLIGIYVFTLVLLLRMLHEQLGLKPNTFSVLLPMYVMVFNDWGGVFFGNLSPADLLAHTLSLHAFILTIRGRLVSPLLVSITALLLQERAFLAFLGLIIAGIPFSAVVRHRLPLYLVPAVALLAWFIFNLEPVSIQIQPLFHEWIRNMLRICRALSPIVIATVFLYKHLNRQIINATLYLLLWLMLINSVHVVLGGIIAPHNPWYIFVDKRYLFTVLIPAIPLSLIVLNRLYETFRIRGRRLMVLIALSVCLLDLFLAFASGFLYRYNLALLHSRIINEMSASSRCIQFTTSMDAYYIVMPERAAIAGLLVNNIPCTSVKVNLITDTITFLSTSIAPQIKQSIIRQTAQKLRNADTTGLCPHMVITLDKCAGKLSRRSTTALYFLRLFQRPPLLRRYTICMEWEPYNERRSLFMQEVGGCRSGQTGWAVNPLGESPSQVRILVPPREAGVAQR